MNTAHNTTAMVARLSIRTVSPSEVRVARGGFELVPAANQKRRTTAEQVSALSSGRRVQITVP
jgi:hypothetical protein